MQHQKKAEQAAKNKAGACADGVNRCQTLCVRPSFMRVARSHQQQHARNREKEAEKAYCMCLTRFSLQGRRRCWMCYSPWSARPRTSRSLSARPSRSARGSGPVAWPRSGAPRATTSRAARACRCRETGACPHGTARCATLLTRACGASGGGRRTHNTSAPHGAHRSQTTARRTEVGTPHSGSLTCRHDDTCRTPVALPAHPPLSPTAVHVSVRHRVLHGPQQVRHEGERVRSRARTARVRGCDSTAPSNPQHACRRHLVTLVVWPSCAPCERAARHWKKTRPWRSRAATAWSWAAPCSR